MKESIVREVSEDITKQMPDHIEPGSLLANIRCRWSIVWAFAQGVGLDNNPRLYKLFSDHLNSEHFGNKPR